MTESQSSDVSIELAPKPHALHAAHATQLMPIPHCEKLLERMFLITLLPTINSKYKLIKYAVPILINVLMGGASMCILYYPSYYPTQGEVWTTDIVLAWGTYNYMIYLYTQWPKAKCYEAIDAPKYVNRISLVFYWLYLIYWFYFAVIQFSTHNEPSTLIQLGNLLMSAAWFIFFSVMAVLYYFVCIKLSQRSQQIQAWLKTLKESRPPIEEFYLQYNENYRAIKHIARHWNILIFIGSLMLTFHVPIDIISVWYKHYYYDIFGLIVKLLSLLWYVWRICDLNDNEQYIIAYLHKHRIYSHAVTEEIEKYVEYRPLGLNFYGLKVNRAFITKVLLLSVNLIIPTIYALFSNKILT
jgi:hypothetical protein